MMMGVVPISVPIVATAPVSAVAPRTVSIGDHHVAYLDSFDRYSATNDVYLHAYIFTLSASMK